MDGKFLYRTQYIIHYKHEEGGITDTNRRTTNTHRLQTLQQANLLLAYFKLDTVL